MEAMLCLGLGAGLDGVDMRYVTGRHVIARSGGLVVERRGDPGPCRARAESVSGDARRVRRVLR